MTKTRENRDLMMRERVHPETYFGELEGYLDRMLRLPFSRLMPPFMVGDYTRLAELSPSVDIFEDGTDVVLKAELPGIRKEDVHISITENTITLTGEKRHEEKLEKKDYHWCECTYGTFTRSFRLPDNVKGEDAKAEFKDGVLMVRIPKTEVVEEKPKTIPIE